MYSYAKVALLACFFGFVRAGGNALGLAGQGLAGGLSYAGHGIALGAHGAGLGYGAALGYGASLPGLTGHGATDNGLGFSPGSGGHNGELLSEHQYSITQPLLDGHAAAYGAGYGAAGAYKINVYGANYASAGW